MKTAKNCIMLVLILNPCLITKISKTAAPIILKLFVLVQWKFNLAFPKIEILIGKTTLRELDKQTNTILLS